MFIIQVDPSGPLATLRKLLLSDESLANFRRWIVNHWYAAALIILAAISLLVRIILTFISMLIILFDTLKSIADFYIRDDRGEVQMRKLLRVSLGTDESKINGVI